MLPILMVIFLSICASKSQGDRPRYPSMTYVQMPSQICIGAIWKQIWKLKEIDQGVPRVIHEYIIPYQICAKAWGYDYVFKALRQQARSSKQDMGYIPRLTCIRSLREQTRSSEEDIYIYIYIYLIELCLQSLEDIQSYCL